MSRFYPVPRFACALLAAALLLSAAGASAQQQPEWKLTAAARSLGAQGIALFRQGKYEEALDKFERAYKLHRAPSLRVRAARCLVQLGRLVEASEVYLDVTRFELGPSAPWPYRSAVKEARDERDELLPRIPKLEIVIKGPRGDGIEVLLDGKKIPNELVDAEQPVDPGDHEILVRRDDTRLTEKFRVAEREKKRVELKLPLLSLPPRPDPKPPDEPDYHKWTVVSFTVAGVGFAAALVNGAIALTQRSDLIDRCPNRDCPPDAHGLADAYDVTRVATTVGFAIAGVGAAAGGALILLRPTKTDEPGGAGLRLVVGPGQAGVRGAF